MKDNNYIGKLIIYSNKDPMNFYDRYNGKIGIVLRKYFKSGYISHGMPRYDVFIFSENRITTLFGRPFDGKLLGSCWKLIPNQN